MAQIQVFQSGNIQPQAPEVTPFRAPDFGPGIGPGVAQLGQALGQTADKINQIADINARIEANRLSVAYNDLATNISLKVRSSLGENAEAAADQGFSDLRKGEAEILSKASPRAKAFLQNEFAKRTSDYRAQWLEHGFEEKKTAYDTSSQAANDKDLDAAIKSSTDDAAEPYLQSIKGRNQQRAAFFGLPKDWTDGENAKYVSQFYKERAASLGVNSAYDAINYAIRHREDLSGDDFNSIVRSYSDEAFHERAASMYYGAPLGSDPAFPRDTPVDESGTPSPTATADPMAVFNGLIIPNEGTKLLIDNNGHPVKMGINQKANPDVDVSKLSLPKAQALFTERYWNAVGADSMAPALAVVAADTAYVAGVGKAKSLLRESGGDVQKMLELRNNFLAELHAKNPGKYPDYTSRNERVEKYAAAVGGNGTPLSFAGKVGPKTPMEPIIQEIMARTDIPLRLKTSLIDMAREDRNAQREDLKMKEDDARDSLVAAATKLDTRFTSIKQLPQEDLANASPEVVASLTRLARTNRYKQDDQKLIPEVTYTEFTDPQKFMSKDYIPELMKKGASPQLLSRVASKQAELLQKQMLAKPDVISDKSLWTIAKPAFEAAGILAHPKSGDTKGKQAAAQQQMQAVGFLQSLATTWEQENPGKKPTPEIMRQWVGAALLNANGKRLYQTNDAELFNSLPDPIRGTIIRGLRRHGDTATGPQLVAHVASAYRQLRALYGTGPIQFRPDDSVNATPLQGVEVGTGLPDMSSAGGIDMSDVDYDADQ